MRKRTGIAVAAMTVMMMALSSCAGIPGGEGLDWLSGASETMEKAESGEAEDAGEEAEQNGDADGLGDSAGLKQSSEANHRRDDIGLKGNGSGQNHGSEESGGQSLEVIGGEDAEGNQGTGEDGTGEDSYARGITSETGWESEYWNLRFTAPEGLYMMNEEGLNAMTGLSEELVSKNYTERQLEYMKQTTLYEMLSTTVTGEANVAATVEKLLVKGMETEDYKKAALLHLRLMQEPVYEILQEDGTVEIAGETYAVVNARTEGENSCFQDYYFRVVGERALIITITYTEETADTAEAILGGFETY